VTSYALGVIGPHGPMGLVPFDDEASVREAIAELAPGYGYTLVEVPAGARERSGTVIEERAFRSK
jgi:hypothetical protein